MSGCLLDGCGQPTRFTDFCSYDHFAEFFRVFRKRFPDARVCEASINASPDTTLEWLKSRRGYAENKMVLDLWMEHLVFAHVPLLWPFLSPRWGVTYCLTVLAVPVSNSLPKENHG